MKLAYADILNYLSHQRDKPEDAVATCEEARKLLVGMGALELADLTAASIDADTADSEARHMVELGRLEASAQLEEQVFDIAEKVLAQRPGDLRSMQNRALAVDLVGRLAHRRHDYLAAERFARRSAEAGENNVRFNPSDLNAWTYWIRGRDQLSDALFEQGHVQSAIDVRRATVALEADQRRPAKLGSQTWQTWVGLAGLQGELGEAAAAQKSDSEAASAIEESLEGLPSDNPWRTLAPIIVEGLRTRLRLDAGDDRTAFEEAGATAARLRALKLTDSQSLTIAANVRRHVLRTLGMAGLRLGRYAEVEAASRERSGLPPNRFSADDPQEERSRALVMQAHAVAKQGRLEEALGLVRPALEFYRREQQRGGGGLSFQRDMAYALCVEAIAQPEDAVGRAQPERKRHSVAAAK